MKRESHMKKSNLITGIAYVLAGILFFWASSLDTPFQSIFAGLAGAGLAPGIAMLIKYFYWNKPENRERYADKMDQERIELHDERKEIIRGKAARYQCLLTLGILALSVFLFQILEILGAVAESRIFIIYLGLLFFLELLLSRLLYRWVERKY